MKVFVIGAHKTGTTSMCAALEVLGFKTSHWIHHEELTACIKQGRFDFPMLQEYDAVGDLPIPVVFRELDEHYPESKFILTVRDTDRWIHSLENRRWWKDREHPIEMGEAEQLFYGFTHFDRERCVDVYEAHNAAVREYFADRPDDLLEFSMGRGTRWDELCQFLGRPVPAVPFPHANKRVVKEDPGPMRFVKEQLKRLGLGPPLRSVRDRFFR